MCLKPTTIKNPLYHRSCYNVVGDDFYEVPSHIKPKDEYIDVPCCICAECRATYFNSILQRGLVESMSSYMYFLTLTYDNAHLPALKLPTGDVIYYCDYSHVQSMFKRFRHHRILDRDFRYLVVNEYGETNHRPHVHINLFVARLPQDSPNTPYFIERLLFDNLGRFFSINVGTRKHPVYERLYTYAIKYTPEGVKTNYFVKYVTDEHNEVFTNQSLSDHYVKTIRYTLSYATKGSKFDSYVDDLLSSIHDKSLVLKLRRILSSSVRFSKGYGLGFVQGMKMQYPRMSSQISAFDMPLQSDYYPDDICEFVDRDPTFLHKFNQEFLRIQKTKDRRKVYSPDKVSFGWTCLSFLIKYMPRGATWFYIRCFREPPQMDCISYFFDFVKPYKYARTRVVSGFPPPSYVRDFIRAGIEEGIANKVPYLVFPLKVEQRYMSLCKFYREHFCSFIDVLHMYESCGVSSYEEWQSLFSSYIDTRKASISNANTLLRESEYIQNNCHSSNTVINLYQDL